MGSYGDRWNKENNAGQGCQAGVATEEGVVDNTGGARNNDRKDPKEPIIPSERAALEVREVGER